MLNFLEQYLSHAQDQGEIVDIVHVLYHDIDTGFI